MSDVKWIVVAELLLDSGTEHVSAERVRRTTTTGSPPVASQIIYSGRVLNWGSIEKSIPCPVGMPQVSDAHIRMRDGDRRWRDLLAHQTPRRRLMRLTLLPEGASIAAYDPIFVGEIIDAVFPAAAVELTLRDRTWTWLDETIPAMAIKELYADIQPQDEGGFIPFVFGSMRSPDTSPTVRQGVIPLPHIGYTGTLPVTSPPDGVDRWGAAVTAVIEVVTVYRRSLAGINDESDNEWEIVDPSEYDITTGSISGFGVDMTHTYVDFLELQPQGTEIRADIDGIGFRGAWGSLPLIGSPPELLQNPIDTFINMTYFILKKAGASPDVFDTDEIAAIRTKFETNLGGSPPTGYLCDGAITQPITAREWLSRFLASFNLDMFQKRTGKITLAFTDETDPARPVFKEGKHILLESFVERLPEHVSNLIQYRYQHNEADGTWAASEIYDTGDQAIEGHIEKEVFDLYFVRDAATALDVTTRRNAFLSLGSYRQEFQLPAPAVFEDIELAKLVGITHSMGLESGGYVNREAKIIGTVLELDQLRYTLRTILREPQLMDEECVRPQTVEAYDWDTGILNCSRSNIDDVAFSTDLDCEDENTFTLIETKSGRSASEQSVLHHYNFPEPNPSRALVSIVITIKLAAWSVPIKYGSEPLFTIDLRTNYSNLHTGDPGFATGFVEQLYNVALSANVALTTITRTILAAEFSSVFGSLAANIFLNSRLWTHSTMDCFTVFSGRIVEITVSGTTARIYWSCLFGSDSPEINRRVQLRSCANAANNGVFIVNARDTLAQWFEVTNGAAVAQTYDETGRGHFYAAVFEVSSVVMTGTTARYNCVNRKGSYPQAGQRMEIVQCVNEENNGVFIVTLVNGTPDWFEVVNAAGVNEAGSTGICFNKPFFDGEVYDVSATYNYA